MLGFKKVTKYLGLGLFTALSAAAVQAGISASAVVDLKSFVIKDGPGPDANVLDFDLDFSTLNYTNSADQEVLLDSETPDIIRDDIPNSTVGTDFKSICLGDCPQIGENTFEVVSGFPAGNYTTTDQLERDAPILNVGSLGSPAFVGNSAYGGIAVGDPLVEIKGSANSNNALSGSFVLTRDVALHFDGVVRVYMEAYASAGEIHPSSAKAATTFSIEIFDLSNGGIPVYQVAPAILNQSTAVNAGNFDYDVLLSGTHTGGIATVVPLSVLPATPTLMAGNLYQISARINTNIDVARTQPEPQEFLGCRLTGGGVTSSTLEDGEIVYVWDGNMWNPEPLSDEENRYQLGGQVGANTGGAVDGQPKGEWQHHQQSGPFGSFSFHAGTASAPAGTEIIEIRCSDPGGCFPSGNPPSPNKQLDFDCIGTFKNIGKGGKAPGWLLADPTVTAEGTGNKTFDGTFHYCEVNVDDLGEGPDTAEPDSDACPEEGFGEKGDPALPANCDCPDFYRITIYDGVDASTPGLFLPDGNIDVTKLNTTDVIYEVDSYLGRGGNGLQLHKPTGFDQKALP